MLKSLLTGRTIIATETNGRRSLHVQIDVDCPECGTFALYLPGHHLRALKQVVDEAVEQYGELVGEAARLEVVRRETFSGQSGGNPEDN